ncbi:MAG: exodeoxyribonuclease III [Maricaulaceae bacterium]|nr:exodeoxyribonuclease III [Maricaulaceae bacterium]
MTALSIASWNVNSVRLRAPLVAKFAAETRPDVICLQEIKCRDGEFPAAAFRDMGYPHIHVRGQKGLHGVAIASRLPLDPLPDEALCPRAEARFQRVKIAGVEIQNYYVPAGGDEPDPAINPRFAHKLEFLDAMQAYFARRAAEGAAIIVTGDLNIAPYEHDVWSHKQLLKVVSHTPIETEGLERVRETGGFTDIARALIPEPEKLYTWWSYRARDWRAGNRGRRLDHIWASAALRGAALAGGRDGFAIFEDCRGWDRPSDHVPVLARLKL